MYSKATFQPSLIEPSFKDQNKYIIIECDKNIGTCIINKKLYEEFAFTHLNDRNVYTKLQNLSRPLEVFIKI